MRWAALLALASAVDAAQAQVVWNIAEHGAQPGGDVTTVLREGLSTQHQHGLPVFIPGHTYYISDTVTLPFRDGVALAGVTVGGAAASDSPHRGAGSRLVWTGPADKPMLVIPSSSLRVTGGLTLVGQAFAGGDTKCAIGLLVSKTGPGVGTGKFRIDWLRLEHFAVGMQFGRAASEANCDEIAIAQLTFRDCEVGYRLVNSQSMGHRLGHVHAMRTPIVLDVRGGGTLSVDSATLIDGTLLRIGKNDPPKFSSGTNNASFRLDGVKVDAQAGAAFRLVEMLDPLGVDITSTGGRVSGPTSGTLAILRGPTALTLRDWANLRAGALELHGTKLGSPNVLVDRSRLHCQPDALIAPTSAGEHTFKTRDCYDGRARPLE